MSSLPLTQKAILQPSPSSTSLTLIRDHPVPTPSFSAQEHLVRVHTVALTNGELLWAKTFPPTLPPNHPVIIPVPGYDVAGTVVLAPPDSAFPPGTEVYGRSDFLRTGSAREYTLLLTSEMAQRPKILSWAESATVPMSAETAWQVLFVHGGLSAQEGEGAKGQRVFVNAASGGVGAWVVQLAKWAGAEVVASCGKGNVEMVQGLGADEVLDREKDVGDWLAGGGKRVDLAVDCIGRKPLLDAYRVLKKGGLLVSVFAPPESERPKEGVEEGVKGLFFIVSSSGEQLGRVTELIKKGGWKTGLDSVFAFDKYEEAFEKIEKGGTKGKVVLDLGVSG